MPFGDAPAVDEGHTTTAPAPPSTPLRHATHAVSRRSCCAATRQEAPLLDRHIGRIPLRVTPLLRVRGHPEVPLPAKRGLRVATATLAFPAATDATPLVDPSLPWHAALAWPNAQERHDGGGTDGAAGAAARDVPSQRRRGHARATCPQRGARCCRGRGGNRLTDRRLAVGSHANRCCGRVEGRGGASGCARRSGVRELPTGRRPLLPRERHRGEGGEAVAPAADVVRRDDQDGPHYLWRAPRQMICDSCTCRRSATRVVAASSAVTRRVNEKGRPTA